MILVSIIINTISRRIITILDKICLTLIHCE